MSYLTDYCKRLRAWIDDEDIDDATVTEWIRDGEERMDNELRTDSQVARTYATFDDNCALMPPDWLETLYIRLKGGRPFDYVSNREILGSGGGLDPPTVINDPGNGMPYPWPGRKQLYTLIGRTLFVWPPIDPDDLTQIEVAYFRKLVPLGDAKDVVFDRYPSIYRHCALAAGAPYLIEDERLPTWMALAQSQIKSANDAYKLARVSGSPICPRIRGFG